ncbi:transposase [Azoarcus sp. TTM-91]|uniref:transposase n=1 Tax=Azoarcus sp. TTM-91 TaxID=2691581 RepID=UPI002006E2F3|nr:transposase [Azoarcus sp. TTM-91]
MVRLLPAACIRAYVRRNKADAAEAGASRSRTRDRISKRGERHLRMLLTHGARAVLPGRGPRREPPPGQPAYLGNCGAAAHSSQQGRLRAGQQACPRLLGRAVRSRRLWQNAHLLHALVRCV